MRAAGHVTSLVPGRPGFVEPPQRGIVILAVPDDAVREAARRFARLKPAPAVGVVHLSGALGLDALDALQSNPVGSFHPLQSFPSPRPPEAFHGITVAVDARTTGLMRRLRALARSIGARPKHVGDGERVLYHASAVFASNFLDVVLREAVLLLEAAGWSEKEATAGLLPLVEGALDNVRRLGVVGALTGPLRRGDVATVRRHLAALHDLDRRSPRKPPLEAVYRMLGTIALEVATQAGLDSAAARRMSRALTRKAAATRRRGRR